MTRSVTGLVTTRRHKRLLKKCKGRIGRSKNCYVIAKQRHEKAMQYSYRDRKVRKRQMRSIWIQRINAAGRLCSGMAYSKLINVLQSSGVMLDRKSLADCAVRFPEVFAEIVSKAQTAST